MCCAAVEQKRKCTMPKVPLLPWWCLPLVWLLVITLALLTLAFILFYGIMFGDYRARLWLTTLLFAFTSSLLLMTPLKVSLSIEENLLLDKHIMQYQHL